MTEDLKTFVVSSVKLFDKAEAGVLLDQAFSFLLEKNSDAPADQSMTEDEEEAQVVAPQNLNSETGMVSENDSDESSSSKATSGESESSRASTDEEEQKV